MVYEFLICKIKDFEQKSIIIIIQEPFFHDFMLNMFCYS